MIWQIWSIALLCFGFGFVIFFHELGHFLAAKYVGIRVEQFAVGFGQALVSWRKGLGWQFGSSGAKYEELMKLQTAGTGPTDAQTVGETEYRLNWIPLGGYVKMLGQDDLRPNAQQDDPRAYNKKSIGARMLVVSAGVIMNIILAAIGFMVLFLMGFRAPPAVAGSVLPGSPAANTTKIADGKIVLAPLRVGDRILYFEDKYQHDFTKITLNVALAEEGVPTPLYVERAESGTREHLTITPRREGEDEHGFLMLGVGMPYELRGLDKKTAPPAEALSPELLPADALAVKPGDIITHINGQPVEVGGKDDQFWKFDRALQESGGNPVELTVRSDSGQTRTESISPLFQRQFGKTSRDTMFDNVDFAGMVPRTAIFMIADPNSPARGKLLPGDVIIEVRYPNGDAQRNPTARKLMDWLNNAGQANKALTFLIERDGKEVIVEGIVPSVKLDEGKRGLGIQLRPDPTGAVIADVLENSPARSAGIPANSRIKAVNGTPVQSWFDVKPLIAAAAPDQPVKLTLAVEGGQSREVELKLTDKQIQQIAGLAYTSALTYSIPFLHERVEPRTAKGPLQAAAWGVTETRDFVMQFYLTLQRMFQGSVSYKNMMGPVGIFNAGRHFAYKGNDWLLWFLAMISANLAVVNFLPIPIVDGGLFTFLIIEKIQGRPLSAKTQSIAQVVGLAVILSVFLLVTYQDIARFL
ncbi:MAG TPA: site-2 protease family protein [Tepidisphaeraceae bacterium]|nr:site-2 protease family protein [Tepidisphaeraceae bacterium]